MKPICNRVLFFVNVFLFSCACHREPEYIRLSDRIVSAYSKKIKNEYGLCLIGSGGSMMKNLKKISLDFECYEKMSVEEARNLYIEIIKECLDRYNQYEIVRPYLNNFPFGWANMEFAILFLNEDRKFSTEGVALVFKGKNGSIVYEGHDGKSFYSLHRDKIEDILPYLAN